MLKSTPSVQPLRRLVADITERHNRVKPGTFVPSFDPAEAGVDARILLVYESPQPATEPGHGAAGSGFMSVDNDDPAAENAWKARYAAGLIDHTLPWNMVPWRLRSAQPHPNTGDLAAGAIELQNLLKLLPQLRGVVLSGVLAAATWDRHVKPEWGRQIQMIRTWNPAPKSIEVDSRRKHFTAALHKAAQIAR